ncbi:hypothetical protein ACCI51_13515 [Microbulbifer echini]|uniref:DUF4136 domain-containing protein n=1 Tax=Microbulbifer echini TaxID=1529067 RepID=A0ABV4NQ98_9GAMM
MIYLKPIFLLAIFALTACSSNQSQYIVPGVSLNKTDKYYVIRDNGDERNLDNLIVEALSDRGYTVSSGPKIDIPENINYLIYYGSQWQWDMTWYLLDFDLRVHTYTDNLFVASSNSWQTSLARKPHKEVISTAVDQLFITNH